MVVLLLASLQMLYAQKFVNLTAEDLKIDSVKPYVAYFWQLPENHNDSVYSVTLKYPEFYEMSAEDVAAYKALDAKLPGEMPEIETSVTCNRKQPVMTASFCPVVFRDGKYMFLVSYMVEKNSSPLSGTYGARAMALQSTNPATRYASHSVLATGKWAKIRVPDSGIYQLTDEVMRRAGFTDPSKVRVYGYGGNIIPEALGDNYLREYDDLKEVPVCNVGGKMLFYGKGPVHWLSKKVADRIRNPYSDYGYYFITESDSAALTMTEQELKDKVADDPDSYHRLYENDSYAWYDGGRNLYSSVEIAKGATSNMKIELGDKDEFILMKYVVSAGVNSKYSVTLNDSLIASRDITLRDYDKAYQRADSIVLRGFKGECQLKVKCLEGGPLRMDYVSLAFASALSVPDFANDKFPAPEYVGKVDNQDLHADGSADMIIIIPTSQKLRAQAERLKAFHESHDSLSVRIVVAGDLYNEFSSGTPDVSAYRRYLKMLYDRAKTESEMPRFVLLFGDSFWDNRMRTHHTASLSPDDYLLCHESEDSFSETDCYVSDDFIAMLDDNEAIRRIRTATATRVYYNYEGTPDVAMGRIPAVTTTEAESVVTKTINYATNVNAGAWQNTLVFLGDDGNSNTHMTDVNEVADSTIVRTPGFYVRKVMWDSYDRQSSSTGHRYPEVSELVKKQQSEGALVFDYAGHGSAISLSHEAVLLLNDFHDFRGKNLPLWVTASCDIMPFDAGKDNIGEAAVLNPDGGAIAFYGTTRTVMSSYNRFINRAFMRYVLSRDSNGNPLTIGEANRLCKQYLVSSRQDVTVNKLHYTLLGDPALALALPQCNAVVDSINGIATSSSELPVLKAGSVVKVKGHVESSSQKLSDFNGTLTALVRDTQEQIVCKLNNTDPKDGATTAFIYNDRPKVIYKGNNDVVNGEFTFVFAVPKDINYSSGTGLITLYAVNEAGMSANGECSNFYVNGTEAVEDEGMGPSLYCYLNSQSFVNGATVQPTPFFVAEIEDQDGINASGAGIGHDMQLVVDDDPTKTYNLNSNFQYDFGSYTTGQTSYVLPALEEGPHTLRFRAWDVLNNSSTVTLNFNVSHTVSPTIANTYASPNPATEYVDFVVTHDHPGSLLQSEIEVMDASGRLLWKYENGGTVTSGNTYVARWNLTLSSGQRLNTGVYLYRVKLSGSGQSWASAARKLIVIGR